MFYYREERGMKLMAVIGDFGLATRIPKKDSPRLPQVRVGVINTYMIDSKRK